MRSGTKGVADPPDLCKYTVMEKQQPNFDRFTFAAIAGRAGQQPANYANDMGDGDFDDYFTAEDYDRRRYERDARRYGYGR